MNELRVRFTDHQYEQIEWRLINSADGQPLDSGEASIRDLRSIAPQGSTVVVFLPQRDVFMTAASLPPRASKQQLAAIGYAIEDQLAEDVENCFFAIGPQQDDQTVPVAVVNQQLADQVMEQLNQAHINLRAVLPEFYLCPQPTDPSRQVTVCPSGAGFIIRTGLHGAMYSSARLLGSLLDIYARQSLEPLAVTSYGQPPPELLQVAEDSKGAIHLETTEAIDLPGASLKLERCINLRQKQYQSSHQWWSLLKEWRWPAVAAALLTAVVVAGMMLDFQSDKSELAAIMDKQYALLAENLPELDAGSNPKRALAGYLADQQGGVQQADFIELLHAYARLQREVNTVKTGRIQYQNGSLAINVESRDLKTMENLRNRLIQGDFPAVIENLNISPEATTGRVVIGAGRK